MDVILALIAIGGAAALATSLRILREYERAVVFRLGRVRPVRGPGLIFLVPFGVERMVRVGLRIIAMDIPPQDVITRDNVSVKVNAVLYFKVHDAERAILEIEDFLFATSQLAQTTLRSVIGQAELDELLAEREKFNRILQKMIDEERYCVDILTQLHSIVGAIFSVEDKVLAKHVKGCVTESLKKGSALEQQKKIDEVVGLLKRFRK